MENLIQVLEDTVTPIEGENIAAPNDFSRIYKKIRQHLSSSIAYIFGHNCLLQWRGQQFTNRFIRAEKDSKLPIQDKIMLLSKAITTCYETFDFEPDTLEMMLVKKVEELNRSLRKQLV